MLKEASLTIALIGIIILILILNSPPKEITNSSQVQNLLPNQKILLSGKVISERNYENSKTLILDNNISIYCDSCPSYLNKSVEILAITQSFNDKISLSLLKISSKNKHFNT